MPAGEDLIYICEKCGLAKNKEVYSGESEECTNCGKTTWRETTACEVGNIFKLGTKFTSAFGLTYLDKEGQIQTPIMGCYGIGTSRLMGVIAELFNDENGLKWPEAITPYKVHLLTLQSKNDDVNKAIAEAGKNLYNELQDSGIEVLFDNREETAGSKFKDSDLIGLPYRVVISEKTLAQNSVEVKKRSDGSVELTLLKDAAELLR